MSKLIQLLSGAACIQVSVFSQDRYIQAAAIFLEFFSYFLNVTASLFLAQKGKRQASNIRQSWGLFVCSILFCQLSQEPVPEYSEVVD